MRFLVGETIDSEADWARATVVNGLGDPLPPGSTETFRMEGLDSDTLYGFSARAEDEDGNISALGAPLLIHTPVSPPPPPPDRSEETQLGDDGEDGDGFRNPFDNPEADSPGDSTAPERPFSLRGPLPSRVEGRLVFEVDLPSEFRPDELVLLIEDPTGREVWRMRGRSRNRDAEVLFVWDGTDATGAAAEPGPYYVIARAGIGRILHRFDLLQ
jgi:hypothetical protein